MQKLYAIKLVIDAVKQTGDLALMRPGLKALMGLVIKAQRCFSMRSSGWY